MRKEKQTELKEVKKEPEKLDDVCQEYIDGWKRCLADFDNYKKDEAERVANKILLAKEDILFDVLSVLDNFERMAGHLPQDLKENDWAKGVLMVEKQLKDILKYQGVQELCPLGEQFDPCFHEALQEVEQEGKKQGEIVEVCQKGYLLNGRLIRPAKVKISK